MSDILSTPPPKGTRRHHHSKSEAPAATSDALNTGSGPRSKNRKGRNRSNDAYQGRQHDITGPSSCTNAQYMDGEMMYDQFVGGKSRKPRRSQQQQQRTLQPPPRLSPETARADLSNNDSRSPPRRQRQTSAPTSQNGTETPAKAYAGPTFHASPAPSALPVPKFFSKSVPADAAPSSLQSRLSEESDTSSSPSPPATEATPSAARPVVHADSPLDIFFKADKEEKARNGSYKSPLRVVQGPSAERHHVRMPSNGSGKGMFMMELDGNETHDLARTPPPLNRIIFQRPEGNSGGRSVTAPSAVQSTPATTGTPLQDREALTRSLKDRLFSMPEQPAKQSSTPGSGAGGAKSNGVLDVQTPSPFHRPQTDYRKQTGPTTPAHAPDASLHYGNRNLSPLFQAASRPDSVKRSSSLRQEVSSTSSPTQGQYPGPRAAMQSPTTSRHQTSNANKPGLSSHNTLQRHIDASGSTPDLANRSFYNGPSAPIYASNNQPSPFHSPQWPQYADYSSTRPANIDVQSLENGLRQMLKLDVSGGNTAPGVR